MMEREGNAILERSVGEGLCSETFEQESEWNGRISDVDTWQRERPVQKP